MGCSCHTNSSCLDGSKTESLKIWRIFGRLLLQQNKHLPGGVQCNTHYLFESTSILNVTLCKQHIGTHFLCVVSYKKRCLKLTMKHHETPKGLQCAGKGDFFAKCLRYPDVHRLIYSVTSFFERNERE